MAGDKMLVATADGGEAGPTEGKNGFRRTRRFFGWQRLGKGGSEATAAATLAAKEASGAMATVVR